MKSFLLVFIFSLGLFTLCNAQQEYDVLIRDGIIYDGSGGKPRSADLAISGDTIAAIGDLKNAKAKLVIDAAGKSVSPGFINMLSWAGETLIEDGRSQSDLRQGVTLEVMGEGWSMGPLNEEGKKKLKDEQYDIYYDVEWNTLGEYLSHLEKRGVSTNVASFVGATSVRQHVIGEDDREPTAAELDSMKLLVRQAMEEGAVGVSSALIYAPAFFAKTPELIALASEAAKYDGMYISHIRSEGNQLHEGVEELISIAKQAGIRAELYHLKAAGKGNWNKIDSVIRRIERARTEGQQITANMYTYTAAATGLTASFPPSLQDGGFGKLIERLRDPETRDKVKKAMNENASDWENYYYGAANPKNIILLSFKQDSLKKYSGKTLADVAALRGTSPEETAMDLVIQDSTRVGAAYYMMSEDNVKKQLKLPWVSFGSDESSYTNEGVFLKWSAHPRGYGTFARAIGKYSRDDKLYPLEEGIRRLTHLPATNLKLKKRGLLQVGNYADVLVFDPVKVQDHATFSDPHKYSTGMVHVFVNGVQVLKYGEHTGAKAGRFVKGPGFRESSSR
jgi:N-acyl-D-amino-acid deacylase